MTDEQVQLWAEFSDRMIHARGLLKRQNFTNSYFGFGNQLMRRNIDQIQSKNLTIKKL